jgi:hypothetical protein
MGFLPKVRVPTERMGKAVQNIKFPEDWECSEPRFKLQLQSQKYKDLAAEVVFKIDDIVDLFF